MLLTGCISLGYALSFCADDSLTLSPSIQDIVEYQVDARYCGYHAGWLTILKYDHQNWIPLKQWFEQSGFLYLQASDNKSLNRLLPFKRRDYSTNRLLMSGYSSVRHQSWKIIDDEKNMIPNRDRRVDYFVDSLQNAWVNERWIKKQYGLTLQFREQALEVDFVGTPMAPAKEWYDFRMRQGKELTDRTTTEIKDCESWWRPEIRGQALKISTWSGRYQIKLDQGMMNSTMLWDAIGHAGNSALRIFGSAKASWQSHSHLQGSESEIGNTSAYVDMKWPGLELQWAWGLQNQINLLISPASWSVPWKITGSNSLLSRLIGDDVPGGIHPRRWNPSNSVSEWSLNQGPFKTHILPSSNAATANRIFLNNTEKTGIPVDLLAGSNRIDYRVLNVWGGISDRCMIWNIPGMMIPQGRWNYRYEISAPMRVSGMLGYGWRSNFSLQVEANVQPIRDSGKSMPWNARGTAVWTAGRCWFGLNEIALTNMYIQWKQQLNFQWSQTLQASIQYQHTSRLDPHNTFWVQGPGGQSQSRTDGNPHSPGVMGQTLDITGQCFLPRGYGLRMFRLEYGIETMKQPASNHLYKAILQFEGWGQQWQYQLPGRSLSWQGRIRIPSSSLNVVYQALVHQDGWQAWTQCHLRRGHHLGLSYTRAIQGPTPWTHTTRPFTGSWTLEWKWIGLQSSRSARAQLNRESANIEYSGQFIGSLHHNTLPIHPVNGLALLHLEFYGDQNANGVKDLDETSLDGAGAFEAPAGVPCQILPNGTAILGPFPNHSRIRLRLTPWHMRHPGWITDRTNLEISSLPNSTLSYPVGLLRSRQITGNLEFVSDSGIPLSSFDPLNVGGIRVHAQLLGKEICDTSGNKSDAEHQTLSLSDGYFEFNDLLPGIYRVWINISPNGHRGQWVPCMERVVDLRQQESAEVAIRINHQSD